MTMIKEQIKEMMTKVSKKDDLTKEQIKEMMTKVSKKGDQNFAMAYFKIQRRIQDCRRTLAWFHRTFDEETERFREFLIHKPDGFRLLNTWFVESSYSKRKKR